MLGLPAPTECTDCIGYYLLLYVYPNPWIGIPRGGLSPNRPSYFIYPANPLVFAPLLKMMRIRVIPYNNT
jgi:hypothetical protein